MERNYSIYSVAAPAAHAGPWPDARVKNGPALAGHGAHAVRHAITRTIIILPEYLRRSLTWDQGAEMAQHAHLKIDAGVQVYFWDPHSPWQSGTNENTNGLLRQYFPRGTDLSTHSADEIAAVAAALNSRPRKTLDCKTPAELLDRLLLSAEKDRVATNRPNSPYTPTTSSRSCSPIMTSSLAEPSWQRLGQCRHGGLLPSLKTEDEVVSLPDTAGGGGFAHAEDDPP